MLLLQKAIMSQLRLKSGFTLKELAITTAVMTILLAIGIQAVIVYSQSRWHGPQTHAHK